MTKSATDPAPLDEFALIERYFAPLAAGEAGAFGLSDDAAIVPARPGYDLVVTKDAIVGGVHFRHDDPPDTIARKLLRVNLSDLAAKGAVPHGYLMACAFPATTDQAWLEDFAAGLAEDQTRFRVTLLGGDTVAMPGPLTLSLTALGFVPEGRLLRRSGAKPGDRLFVSGTIGDAVLGLMLLDGRLSGFPPRETGHLVARYRTPEPRLALGARLADLAHAALDVSDGLVADLGHLARCSGVRARLELAALPLSPGGLRYAGRDADRRTTLATGGDDYEIVFAASPEAAAPLAALAAETDVALTPIGWIEEGEGVVLVDETGATLVPRRTGYRHFAAP